MGIKKPRSLVASGFVYIFTDYFYLKNIAQYPWASTGFPALCSLYVDIVKRIVLIFFLLFGCKCKVIL
jgi:hypothetical protein